MKLKHIVLHQIIKEQMGKPTLKTSDSLLPISEVTEEFVDKIIKSYAAKNPTYGVFEKNKEIYPFQTYVEGFRKGGSFLNFSKKAMKILKKEIDSPTTTGGYVVFILYSESKVDFLITIMLDNSISFSVNDANLTIKKLQSLDIERLARANRINFDKWKNDEPQYLSFIKGTRGISLYFQKFIGSTDLTSSRENTNNLKDAMAKYMGDKGYTSEEKKSAYHKVNDYAKQKYDMDEDLELNAIAVLIDEMTPEGFTNYIQDNEDLEVSGSFRVTQKTHLKFLTWQTVKEKGYSLEFDRGLIGKKIRKIGSDIVIKNVPAGVLKEFN
jgi:nucleoid-associated protein YejK